MQRVIIATDIRNSGEVDDKFSLFHILCFQNKFEILGFVISKPAGTKAAFNNIYKRFNRDAKKFGFPKANYKVREGAKAAKWIKKMAKQDEVIILCWGSCRDVAEAIKLDPKIIPNLKVFLGGVKGYNYQKDPEPYKYLKKIPSLFSIWTDGPGGALNVDAGGKLDNKYFTHEIIGRCGATGKYLASIAHTSTTGNIKWGDTQGVLFTMDDGWANPAKQTMGGKFKKIEGTKHWEDLPNGSDYIENKKARKMWKERLDTIYRRNNNGES